MPMNHASMNRTLPSAGPLMLAALIFIAALSRVLPHPPNFSPIEAVALFGGAYFAKRHWALLVPLAAMFASDLDAASRRQLARGARLTELLKQPQYSPYPVEEQVVSIWAGTNGKLDEVPVEDVLRFERELIDHIRRSTDVLGTIASTGKLGDDAVEALKSAIEAFAPTFQTSDGDLLGSNEPVDDEGLDVEQEQIVRQKRG